MRPLGRRVCHEVLDVGAYALLRRGKVRALRLVARCAEAAVVVLLGQDVAAVGEEARLLQCLAERDIGTHAFGCRLLVVEAHDLLDGAGELRLRIAPTDERRHLLGRRFRRAQDLDALGRRLLLQNRLVQRLGDRKAHLRRRLLVDRGGKLCRKVRTRDEYGRGGILPRGSFRRRIRVLRGSCPRLRRCKRRERSRTCDEERRKGGSRQEAPRLFLHSYFGHKAPPSSCTS